MLLCRPYIVEKPNSDCMSPKTNILYLKVVHIQRKKGFICRCKYWNNIGAYVVSIYVCKRLQVLGLQQKTRPIDLLVDWKRKPKKSTVDNTSKTPWSEYPSPY